MLKLERAAPLALSLVSLLSACSDNHEAEGRHVEKTFGAHTTQTDRVEPLFIQQTGSVLVRGVWVIEGDDKIADPVNLSTIECVRSDGFCTDQRAWITTSKEYRPTLMQASDLYEIKTFEPNHVTAELYDGGCRTIALDISAEAVTTVTKGMPGCEGIIPGPEKPRLARLVTGSQLDEMRRKW